ncbi:MAG TPA: flagellar basal body P-ring formation chaperone FlgA [Devosia sp.]|nr:flagellar basal body P-ring formation chaperone FlgA [Devosia sp.]
MIRTLLTGFATALLAGTAFAAPTLKADIVVSAAVVTVGDMFDDAGTAAEQPLFRSPRPGTSGLVPLTDITAAAARVGIIDFDNNGASASRVTRAASVVDEARITQLIAADLRQRGIMTEGMTADTLFNTPIMPINAEPVATPASIVSLRYLPGTGTFTARLAIAGEAQPLDVAGTIELMIEAPHLRASLPAGTVLGPDNIEMRPVALRFADGAGIAQPNQLIGMALTRQSREGMMLKPSDVTTPQLIAKNQLVTIYFRKGPMTLTVKGQAITSAAAGGPVQVLNLASKRLINATAISAGAVEVSIAPLSVAGL